jgi:hypothetical protein
VASFEILMTIGIMRGAHVKERDHIAREEDRESISSQAPFFITTLS